MNTLSDFQSSPPCARSGGARRISVRAFTLVELMIAISLSLVIMLVAVTAFRQASQTISLMNRLSVENGMLRTGYFITTEDVDFWNSHANPDYPYLKGHMSDAVLAFSGNNLENKRLFRPVTFSTATAVDFNPNWALPHDARSWYRNYLMPNPKPLIYDRAQADGLGGSLVGANMWNAWLIDPNVPNPLTKHLNYVESNLGEYQIPIGWSPRTVAGDYSRLSTINLAYTGIATTEYEDVRWPTSSSRSAMVPNVLADPNNQKYDAPLMRGARPNLMWQLFKELGHVGVFTYMPSGTINIIQCPNLNDDPDVDVKSQALNFCKGEIPWSLDTPVATGAVLGTLKYYIQPTNTTTPAVGVIPDNTKGNYFYGMPSTTAKICFHRDGGHGFPTGDYSPPEEGFGGSTGFYAADLDAINGDAFWMSATGPYTGWTQLQSRTSVGMFYGTKFMPSDFQGLTYDARLIDSVTRDPIRALDKSTDSTESYYNQGGTRWENNARTMTFWRQASNNTSQTVHLPRNYTDDLVPNLSDRSPSTPAMSTGIMRYRHRSLDKAICTVRVQDPTTGRVLELGYTMVGTTLRGARQHWGWKTNIDRPTAKKIGDMYSNVP
ncbi:MAG: prepilin-type N-terminal cleavage/methylation domain-containing protein [Planctomycetes bacterium]|nr:prepilin-type N-terminal cleavage/methylation domain-containing protein [Planctomycetota bacterium]